jgi:hypothetical protein
VDPTDHALEETAVKLTPTEALGLRMASLLLREHPGVGARRPADVAGVVRWFGAMQAQDLASGLWSLGLRLPSLTQADVEAALERREALRTWPMRGTMHLVPPRDARWMLALMGERPLAGAAARRAYLGLDDATADRAVDLLGAALAGGGRLTRAECIAALEAGGIASPGQVGYHLLWYASQHGVTCIAPNRGKEQTFALLDEWAPDPHRPDRDEALGTMARRYFRSHGPTTRQDFAGWTGLTAADAKRGLAVAADELATVQVNGQEMYLDRALLEAHAGAPLADGQDDLVTPPGFDEYLLGYKDRALMIAPEHMQAIIPGGNGMFRSTLVRGGRVVGTWKRTMGRRRTVVDLLPLVPLDDVERARIEAAFGPYERFLGSPIEPRWPAADLPGRDEVWDEISTGRRL